MSEIEILTTLTAQINHCIREKERYQCNLDSNYGHTLSIIYLITKIDQRISTCSQKINEIKKSHQSIILPNPEDGKMSNGCMII